MPRAVRLPLLALGLATALAGCPQPQSPGATEAPAPASEEADAEANALYAFGASLARYASGMKLAEADVKAIQEGLSDALLAKPLRVNPRDYGAQIQKVVGERRAAAASEEKKAGEAYLAEAAAAPGAEKTASGLVYLTLTEGNGPSPKATDRVKVHYKGMLRDGTEFDSSTSRGQPAVFNLNRVVPCWTEGVQKMKVGGKAKLSCPSELGYGERGVPGRIPPGAPLVFEVELLEILPEVAQAKPPANAPAAKPGAPAAKPGSAAKPDAGAAKPHP
jgi:FKBP-type peptidyl-prolyl cis-trans isomerase